MDKSAKRSVHFLSPKCYVTPCTPLESCTRVRTTRRLRLLPYMYRGEDPRTYDQDQACSCARNVRHGACMYTCPPNCKLLCTHNIHHANAATSLTKAAEHISIAKHISIITGPLFFVYYIDFFILLAKI